jgi:uncharacterized protein (DUF2267 family)
VTLREAVARALNDDWARNPQTPTFDGLDPQEQERWLAAADAVLRVVRDRLLSNEAAEAATEAWGFAGEGENLIVSRAALAAAWASIEGDKGRQND